MPFTAGQRLLASQLNANLPQLLGSTILSGSQPSITIAIPAGFNHLQGIFTGRKDVGGGGAYVWLRFNGDTGNNYLWQVTQANNTSATQNLTSAGAVGFIRIGLITGASDTANYFGSGGFSVGNISSTSAFKVAVGGAQCQNTVSNSFVGTLGGQWNSTSAITSVTLLPDAGNLIAGSSMSIYGWE